MFLISSSVVGSGGSATIDFTSIPQTYTDLLLKLSCRSTTSGGVQDIAIRFNGDTASSYLYVEAVCTGAATSSGSATTTRHNTIQNSSSTTSTTFSVNDLYIPNYTDSLQKSSVVNAAVESNSVSTNTQIRMQAWKWSGTSAITSISVFDPTGGTFVQFSSARLYGIKNS